MEEPLDEIAFFSTALRDICPPQEREVGNLSTESDNEFVDILSLETSNKEIFLNVYNEFKETGAAVREYNLKWPQRREELLHGFIATWKESHEPESFYASGFRHFLIK